MKLKNVIGIKLRVCLVNLKFTILHKIFKQRTFSIQKVFDKVIAAGIFQPELSGGDGMLVTTPSMIHALAVASDRGIISYDEAYICDLSIRRYLGDRYTSLELVLAINGIDNSFDTRLGIYKNWAARPELSLEKLNDYFLKDNRWRAIW